ncbi:RDD family protein [Phycicoccus flavus]|uniref:RDD family protein n=1 Tax=Phycicoccus flavus TaxID=2502783 RepID=A0A8T6R055_9MICO|nr:RDD family protein [Phycicoccus flavus]NHA67779.1 RDD family protein [Phycicoccus flavus]
MAIEASDAAGPRDRLAALGLDYLVVVGLLAGAALVGVGVQVLGPDLRGSVLATDLLALACSVLPVALYLGLTEGGAAQATWGKRRRGLVVTTVDGRRVGRGRALARAAVKLLPWQLAHVAVVRLALEVDAPIVVGVTYGASLLLLVLTLVLAWRTARHRALHDLVAGTVVVDAPGPSCRPGGLPA